MRQPPLVNRRSSVNRLVNRQPVDAGERFASDCVIRHTVFTLRDSPRKSLKIATFRANLHLSRHQRHVRSSYIERISEFCL